MTRLSLGTHRFGKNLALAATGAAVSFAIVLGVTNVSILRAQSAASPDVRASKSSDAPFASFEVVSIKPNGSGSKIVLINHPLSATNVSAKTLIAWAYNDQASFQLSDDRILGGPSWISSEKYDIDAKEEDSVVSILQKLPADRSVDQIRLMVQSLLADRFKLKVSHETRDLPMYALIVAKSGPKMTESTKEPSLQFRTGEITATAVPTRAIAQMLSRKAPTGCAPPELEGREVRDETGLSGIYDFTLKWNSEPPIPVPDMGRVPAPETTGPSVFTALEEQLGLRLKSTKAPTDVVVIEHIEEPPPN